MFSDVLRMLSGAHVCSLDVLSYVCSKCVQRFSDVHRYSQIFCGYSKDDLRMFSGFFMMVSGCSHNILRVLWWTVDLVGLVGLMGLVGPMEL